MHRHWTSLYKNNVTIQNLISSNNKEEQKMTKTTLKIDGMMCGMCESHMNDAIRSHFKVKKVTSSHASGETVIISEEPLDGNGN